MASLVIQLTDLHLFADVTARLRGVPTMETLRDVLQWTRSWLDERGLTPSAVVITGDLAHDEQPTTYERLADLLGDWCELSWVIPGNHDHPPSIREVFRHCCWPSDESLTFSTEIGNWRMIGLDSHLPGEVHGRIVEAQLEWLEHELSAHVDQPTLLFVHHPPYLINSEWLDSIGLENADKLQHLIAGHSQVRIVSAGHVHQEFSKQVGNVLQLTSPSTAVQFKPGAKTFACDMLPPGCRLFSLEGDSFTTDLLRLPRLAYAPNDEPS